MLGIHKLDATILPSNRQEISAATSRCAQGGCAEGKTSVSQCEIQPSIAPRTTWLLKLPTGQLQAHLEQPPKKGVKG